VQYPQYEKVPRYQAVQSPGVPVRTTMRTLADPSKSPESLSLRSDQHSREIEPWNDKNSLVIAKSTRIRTPPSLHKPFERSELPHQQQQTTPNPIASPRHTSQKSQPATPESCPSPQRLQWCDVCAVPGPVCLISPVARRVAKGSDEESRAGDRDGRRLVEPAG
jgi:hypothetical protein